MYIVFPRARLRISLFALPCLLLMLWLEGAAAFSVMLFSAAWHELGHLLAVKMLKYRVRRVDILPMGALIVLPEGINHRGESIIALSGPAFSFFGALALAFAFVIVKAPLLLFGAVVNCLLALFNLMPVRKLDGGKALYCFLAYKNKKAERFCSAASITAKAVFVFFVTLCFMLSDMNLGVALLGIALVLQL